MKTKLILSIALLASGSICVPQSLHALNQDEQKNILVAAAPLAFTCYKLGKWAKTSPAGLKTVKILSKVVGTLATASGAVLLAQKYPTASNNLSATSYAIGSFVLGLSSCSLVCSLGNDYFQAWSEFIASFQPEQQQI